jgi:hypothetical protein
LRRAIAGRRNELSLTIRIKSDTAPVVESSRDFSRDKILIFIGSPLWHIHCYEKSTAMISKILLLAVLLLISFNLVEAQQPKKVPRIGYLSPSDAATESTRAEPIRWALRELGYMEGKNIAVEYRYAEGKLNRFSELADELVRLKVDIIVVTGDASIRAVKNATKTIPIVMAGTGSDPVEAGLVESLPVPAATSPALQPLAEN